MGSSPTIRTMEKIQNNLKIRPHGGDNLKIIPLGGLGEVGRNMMLLEIQGKILIIDMGFRMPEEDMPGIDYIIPNINYLKGKAGKTRLCYYSKSLGVLEEILSLN